MAATLASATLANAAPISLDFDGQTYLLRWSSQHQREFTPAGQDDLNRWSDMVTINIYPGVSGGEGLADGRGTAVIVSHRQYGQQAKEAMAAWLKAKGACVERNLMALDRLPSHRLLEPPGR